uniref:Nephrocystin 4 n=1 Tax=Pundamilia nyererei TaxID=303518 RepID=A0A3B4G272_9CICH
KTFCVCILIPRSCPFKYTIYYIYISVISNHNMLKISEGAHLACVLKKHPALDSVLHLFPENVLVSGEENIPGLVASPTGDALLKPQTLKTLPFTLNRLTISLQPSLEKFESQLLQLINADLTFSHCFANSFASFALYCMCVSLCFFFSSTSSLPQILGLRSSLELRLTNHQALAIIFQLEYVFSTPIGRETMLSATSTSRAAFLHSLRWGIWCPFQEPAEWKGEEIQLVLQEGAKPNPHGAMVYSTEVSAKAQSPAPISAPVSSRSSLAHLFSAGFPDIVDSSGQVADVLDPTEPLPFDPNREENDLQGNLLVFQFLAFTRIAAPGVGPDWPENIYFTFQFYRFPPVTSQRLKLLTGDKVQHKASNPLPCVLASINKDGTVNTGSPGLQLQFRVDDSFLKPGEKRWFLHYLALHAMHIDIWDSDSLLLIGSTAIELKYMLRQCKSAVQALHEVEVLTTDYVGEDTLLTNPDLGRHSASSPMTVHTIVRGRLHIRTGNIGKYRKTQLQLYCSIVTFLLWHNNTNVVKKATILLSILNKLFLNKPDDSDRKLKCMAAVREREASEDAKTAKVAAQSKKAQLANPSEAKSKAESIANMLSQAITTQHLLYASLGSAEYMEFVLKNPFNVPQTVTIHSDDPELSVITNTEEWRYFKALTRTPTPLEENMFHSEQGAPGPRVYLRPKESLHVPLKYQSFLCDHTMALQVWCRIKVHSHSMFYKVTFKAEDGKPMAICQVNVEPTPHVVDQTFRLYHPELCFLKKAIRLPVWHDPAPGEPQDVYLKVPGSPSPHIKMFFVMVFTDKWMAAPSQIWQIYVHFLERVDVSCVTGQRSCQSLVLRGTQAIRKVKCFSSHPGEIEVDPAGVFVLPPAAVQELQLKVQPWQAGSRFLYVNAVDVEQQRLVTAWLLCLNVHRPVLSKAFEVCVPVGGGRGSSRKITYTNPYTSSRTFLLRSDHPDLLQFKEDKFQIGGGESYTIGLRFATSQSPGSVDILVYVNNLEEKTEETFCVKVNYS